MYRQKIFEPHRLHSSGEKLATKADLLENPFTEYHDLMIEIYWCHITEQWHHISLKNFHPEVYAEKVKIPLFWSFVEERYVIHPLLEDDDNEYMTKFSRPVVEGAWDPDKQRWDHIDDNSGCYGVDLRVILFYSLLHTRYTPYSGCCVMTPPPGFTEKFGCFVTPPTDRC